MRARHIQPISPKSTLVTEVGCNKCIISGSQQCILGQGKLVMVLVQLTLCKIIMICLICTFILDSQHDNGKSGKSILPEFHLSETWILAKSCLL